MAISRQGTILNQALSSLVGGLLEITPPGSIFFWGGITRFLLVLLDPSSCRIPV